MHRAMTATLQTQSPSTTTSGTPHRSSQLIYSHEATRPRCCYQDTSMWSGKSPNVPKPSVPDHNLTCHSPRRRYDDLITQRTLADLFATSGLSQIDFIEILL